MPCVNDAQEAGNVLIGLSRPFAANVVLFLRSGAWSYPVIALAIASPESRSITNVLLAWIVGTVASIVVAAWFLRGLDWRAASRESIDWAGIRSGLKTAAPFMLTGGASLGLLFFDRFVVEAYHGLDSVGVFTFFAAIATPAHAR